MMNLLAINKFDNKSPLRGPFHLIAPYSIIGLKDNRQIRDTSLPNDFSDYLVYITRKSLYAATTTLSKVSAKLHDFFMQLNMMLTFERMIRNFWAWSATAIAPWSYGIDQSWGRPSTQEQALATFWGSANRVMPRYQTEQRPYIAQTMPETNLTLPIFASAISASMAFLTFAPALMQCWNVGASHSLQY